MKKNFFTYIGPVLITSGLLASMVSCNYKKIVDYPFTETLYLPAAAFAAFGAGGNGVYSITPAVQGQSARYLADKPAGKFDIPLSVMRSAVKPSGTIPVNLAVNTDTITKLIAGGKFAVTTDPAISTEILPASAYSLPANVIVADNNTLSNFTLAVDLNFIIASATNTPKKRYAVGIGIAVSDKSKVDPVKNLAIIFIDPVAVILPTANFTTYTDNTYKTVGFVNISLNGTSYSWDYGDGTPVSPATDGSHKYAASGTYAVTLKATGISGATAVKTLSVTVL